MNTEPQHATDTLTAPHGLTVGGAAAIGSMSNTGTRSQTNTQAHTHDAGATSTKPSGVDHIHSFVHRRSHITAAQQQALDQLLPMWSIPYRNAVLDLRQAFGRDAPTILEIGFGMGETTHAIAAARPGDNFLGVEVFDAGVGGLLKRIDASGLDNIRIVQHDALEVVRDMIAPDSLQGVHVFFPDPWPKKRHHKRRLIQPPFVALLANRIAPGGYLHCATDWRDYAEQMLTALSGEPRLVNQYVGYAPRPDDRPQTKFEARGLRLGHGVWDLMFLRRPVSEQNAEES